MTRAICLVLMLVSSALWACGREPSPGAALSPPDEGVRAVILSPALGAIARDLGLAGRVVGRHAWDRGFPGVTPVGDQAAIDYERLRRLEPTHVLLQWGDRRLPARLVELAEGEGWVVESIEILTLDEIARATRRVADLIGDEAAGVRAGELVERLERATREREGLAERAGRVVSIYGVDPLGVAGSGSFTHELVASLGAEPIPTEGAAFITMDPEDLRRLDPDTIVVWAPGLDEPERERVLGPLRRLELRALERGRVIFVTSDGALLPSTTMIAAAEELAGELMELLPLGLRESGQGRGSVEESMR